MHQNIYELIDLAFRKVSDLHLAGQNFRSDIGVVEGSLLLKNSHYQQIGTINAVVDIERGLLTLSTQHGHILTPRGGEIPPLVMPVVGLAENEAQEQIVAFVRRCAEAYGLLEPEDDGK